MIQTICFDVVCLENVLLRHAFSGPQPLVRAADLARNVYFGAGSSPHQWCGLGSAVRSPSGVWVKPFGCIRNLGNVGGKIAVLQIYI